MGVWALAMDTLSQVLVATALAVVIGVALGVWAAESNRVSKALRPVNDMLQTLPQLVYIIPFIYLMPVSIVPGIVAGVLYAFPVVIRLVERGVRDVAPTSVEAASAFGASRRQVLMKVKIPLAGDAIMLGINQGDHHGARRGRDRRARRLGRRSATRSRRVSSAGSSGRAWSLRSRSSRSESRSTASRRERAQSEGGHRMNGVEHTKREGRMSRSKSAGEVVQAWPA